MKIAFDLDGVLYSWHLALWRELQIYENLEDDYFTFWTKTWLTIPKYKWNFYTNIETLYSSQVPDKRLIPFLNKVSKNNEIYYITNRSDSNRTTTIQYLKRWKFPQFDNLEMVDDKEITCKELGIDCIVEDREKNATKCSEVCDVFLVEQPWNTGFTHERVVTIRDVYELEKFLWI